MSKLNGTQPEGYFEYVVPPLEALWGNDELEFDYQNQKTWVWQMMIRQPEFVHEDFIEYTREYLRKKKPGLSVDNIKFITLKEGKAIQIMHIEDYESESISADKLHAYMEEHHLKKHGLHHEIYVSDPRRTKPEKLKTVIRIPVRKKCLS